MLHSQLTKVCALSVGMCCFWLSPTFTITAKTPPVIAQQFSPSEILQQLIKADVVYLGETHAQEADHRAQLKIIQSLHAQNPQIAIAMEMFQRPFQDALNAYIAGEISETELLEATEYEQRWGFPWEYYAPILRFARQHSLPIIALNTPSEVTRKVARQGLESLTVEERQHIPPLEDIHLSPPEYRQMLKEVYAMHAHGGHGNSEGFENFFSAQVLWDETMAEAIAHFRQANPNHAVIVLAGQGHIAYGYGIPQRVARRAEYPFKQYSVLFGTTSEDFDDDGVADFFWSH